MTMQVNLKPSQRAAIVGAIDAQSSAAAKSTGWIDAATFHNYLAKIGVGALGANATVDAKLEQANKFDGSDVVKDVAGKAIMQLTKANNDDSKQAVINLKQEDLDFAGGFKWFRLTITPAVAASLIDGMVMGFDPRYGFASDVGNKAASQAQTV
ncbi:MAG: hypothetical protein J0G28_14375 [Afipia sp.]|nr:hypothetical protein [Afipia sp.]